MIVADAPCALESRPPMIGSERAPAIAKHFSRNLASLRGIAALIVVACHCLLILRVGGIDDAYMIRLNLHDFHLTRVHALLCLFNGPACVTLFFVLSGTVLAMSLDRGMAMRWSALPAYWIKRVFRLYPLLVGTALMAALLQRYFFTAESSTLLSTWGDTEYKIPGTRLFHELALNAMGASSSLNSPAWSIKIEILVSLLFPALFVLSRSRRFALPFLLLLILLMFVVPNPRATAYVNVFAASFFLGALAYRWGRPWAEWYLGKSALFRYVLFAAVMMIFVTSRRIFSPVSFISPNTVFIEMFCATFVVLVALYGHSRILATKPLLWLGEISYSVYLVHVPILFVVTHLALRYGMIPATGNQWLPVSLLMGATLALTLPFATVTHRLIEAPGQALGSRLGRSLSFSVKSREVPAPAALQESIK
jgi:peptidoglycan/LPS O-acetylase OafA/YrhL